jgi:hypothetical protein
MECCSSADDHTCYPETALQRFQPAVDSHGLVAKLI